MGYCVVKHFVCVIKYAVAVTHSQSACSFSLSMERVCPQTASRLSFDMASLINNPAFISMVRSSSVHSSFMVFITCKLQNVSRICPFVPAVLLFNTDEFWMFGKCSSRTLCGVPEQNRHRLLEWTRRLCSSDFCEITVGFSNMIATHWNCYLWPECWLLFDEELHSCSLSGIL